MMLRAEFQLLNWFLTILLHLCCSSAPSRLHDSTFMRSAQSESVLWFLWWKVLLFRQTPRQILSVLHDWFSSIHSYHRILCKEILHWVGFPTIAAYPQSVALYSPRARANAGTTIAMDRICDNTKETASGFEKWYIPSASITTPSCPFCMSFL